MQREGPPHGGATQPSLRADPRPQRPTLLHGPPVGPKDSLYGLVETVGVERPGVAEVPAQVQADAGLSEQVLSSDHQPTNTGAVQLCPQMAIGDEPGRYFQIRIRSFGRGAFVSPDQYLGRLPPTEAQREENPLYVGGCGGLHRLKIYGLTLEIAQPAITPGIEAQERFRLDHAIPRSIVGVDDHDLLLVDRRQGAA